MICIFPIPLITLKSYLPLYHQDMKAPVHDSWWLQSMQSQFTRNHCWVHAYGYLSPYCTIEVMKLKSLQSFQGYCKVISNFGKIHVLQIICRLLWSLKCYWKLCCKGGLRTCSSQKVLYVKLSVKPILYNTLQFMCCPLEAQWGYTLRMN